MSTLFLATGDAVARLEGEGEAWNASLRLSGQGVQCLAVDATEPGRIYAGSRGRGVFESDDGGETWRDAGLPQPDVFSLAVSPVDGTLYAGCEPSMVFRRRRPDTEWEELDALRRIPSAPRWSFPPRPWTSHVRWIAPSPHEALRLLVGIELGGVMLSEDGGETWSDHRPGAQPDVHALAWHPTAPGRAYEAGGGGAAWSFDGGRTWRGADEGRDRHYTWALAVDPEDPDCWFVSASPGPRQAHSPGRAAAFVYRWRGGGPWETLGGGLPQPLDSMPYALAFANGALYAALADGRLYASRDRGESWTELDRRGDRISSATALAAGY